MSPRLPRKLATIRRKNCLRFQIVGIANHAKTRVIARLQASDIRIYRTDVTFYNDLHSFYPQPARFNDLNYPTRQYACLAGRLLLFRSDLVHGTGRQGPGEKIVISFNVGY